MSFNEEDVVIRFKKTDILSTVHKSGKTIQVELLKYITTICASFNAIRDTINTVDSA